MQTAGKSKDPSGQDSAQSWAPCFAVTLQTESNEGMNSPILTSVCPPISNTSLPGNAAFPDCSSGLGPAPPRPDVYFSGRGFLLPEPAREQVPEGLSEGLPLSIFSPLGSLALSLLLATLHHCLCFPSFLCTLRQFPNLTYPSI